MGKRRIKLNEDDLKSFLGAALQSSGYMTEDAEIVGFEYTTKTIKAGGDYYKDGVNDPEYKGVVEVVKFIKVLTETGGRRKKKEDSDASDDGS